jgi:hypothetical protein
MGLRPDNPRVVALIAVVILNTVFCGATAWRTYHPVASEIAAMDHQRAEEDHAAWLKKSAAMNKFMAAVLQAVKPAVK